MFAQLELGQVLQIEGREFPSEDSAEDDHALIGDGILDVFADGRVVEVATEDEVETDSQERQAEELEGNIGVVSRVERPNADIPEDRETAPEQTERDEKCVLGAKSEALFRRSRPHDAFAGQKIGLKYRR